MKVTKGRMMKKRMKDDGGKKKAKDDKDDRLQRLIYSKGGIKKRSKGRKGMKGASLRGLRLKHWCPLRNT